MRERNKPLIEPFQPYVEKPAIKKERRGVKKIQKKAIDQSSIEPNF